MSSQDIITIDTSTYAEESDSSLTEVMEDIVKLEVDEKKLKTADFVYKTEESTDEDPMNEDEAFDALPSRKKRIYERDGRIPNSYEAIWPCWKPS